MTYGVPKVVSTTTTSKTFEPFNEVWTSAPVNTHSSSHTSSSNSWNEDKIVNQPIEVRDYSGMVNTGTTIISLQNLKEAMTKRKPLKKQKKQLKFVMLIWKITLEKLKPLFVLPIANGQIGNQWKNYFD